ncbi:hypothetical protein AB4Y63_17655 [Leifsonia sp. YAF41]|uniref:hypothetical protein n=1 Tax=Leifsonia sp. YAF41 TaxID=3233086 RepID=UPI003F988ECB
MNSKIFKTRPRLTKRLALALIPLAALGLVGVGISQSANAQDSNDPAVEVAQGTISASFDATQAVADELPTFLQTGRQALEGVVTSTTRHLGTNDGVEYWIAANDKDQFCLVVLLPGPGQYASMTCQDGNKILSSGIGMQAADREHAIVAYVLPTGYDADLAGFTKVGDQLLVGDSSVAAPELTAHKSGSMSKGVVDEITLPNFPPLSSKDVG